MTGRPDVAALTAAVAEAIAGAGGPDGTVQLARLRVKPDGTVSAGYLVGAARHRVTVTTGAGYLSADGVHPEGVDPHGRVSGVSGRWPGVLHIGGGLRLEPFPVDAGLPALQALVGDPSPVLPRAAVDVVRHKPGARCVLRVSDGARTVYVKLYRDAGTAAEAWQAQQELAAADAMAGQLPAPLRLLPEWAAVVTDAVPGTPGSWVLRPGRCVRGRALLDAAVPAGQLRAAGAALARLHAVPVDRFPRAAAGDAVASKTTARAAEIASANPARAGQLGVIVDVLVARLAAGPAGRGLLGHGAFKPSQLLLDGDRVAVTDFDGLDRAEPARDVGYFLGYLRPAALLRGVDGARIWFDAAAAEFLSGYTVAAAATGMPPAELDVLPERAQVYAAVALVKQTARRAHRLNAPRDGELAAVLDELRLLLDGPVRGGAAGRQ